MSLLYHAYATPISRLYHAYITPMSHLFCHANKYDAYVTLISRLHVCCMNCHTSAALNDDMFMIHLCHVYGTYMTRSCHVYVTNMTRSCLVVDTFMTCSRHVQARHACLLLPCLLYMSCFSRHSCDLCVRALPGLRTSLCSRRC